MFDLNFLNQQDTSETVQSLDADLLNKLLAQENSWDKCFSVIESIQAIMQKDDVSTQFIVEAAVEKLNSEFDGLGEELIDLEARTFDLSTGINYLRKWLGKLFAHLEKALEIMLVFWAGDQKIKDEVVRNAVINQNKITDERELADIDFSSLKGPFIFSKIEEVEACQVMLMDELEKLAAAFNGGKKRILDFSKAGELDTALKLINASDINDMKSKIWADSINLEDFMKNSHIVSSMRGKPKLGKVKLSLRGGMRTGDWTVKVPYNQSNVARLKSLCEAMGANIKSLHALGTGMHAVKLDKLNTSWMEDETELVFLEQVNKVIMSFNKFKPIDLAGVLGKTMNDIAKIVNDHDKQVSKSVK